MAEVPQEYKDLLTGMHFAHLSTLMPDGSPQVTPVWVDFDGNHVLINSALGRQKDRNIERDSRIAISVNDQANPYRYIQVRGKVTERTTDGADAHIDALAKRYMGVDSYPFRTPEETRVIYKLAPENVNTFG